jgi:hypothetical protein
MAIVHQRACCPRTFSVLLAALLLSLSPPIANAKISMQPKVFVDEQRIDLDEISPRLTAPTEPCDTGHADEYP